MVDLLRDPDLMIRARLCVAAAALTLARRARALRTTAVRRRAAVKLSRTAPLLGEAGSRTGARRRRRAGRRPAAMASPTGAVCGAAAGRRRQSKPRGRTDGEADAKDNWRRGGGGG